MPFFRPERALARLLRHDHFSPFSHSHSHFHSPLSLTRLFDHHTPFAAPLYTIFEEPRDNHQHNNPRLTQPTDKKDQSSSSSSSSNNQVARSEREDGMERRDRRHRGRHHHLSPFSNNFFSSPFPSLFNAFTPITPFTPFAPSSIPSTPDITLDMFSTPTSYSIHAAVPGLDKKDIKLTVDDGVLTIEAERRESRPSSSSTSTPSTTSTSPQTSVETKADEKTGADSNAATANTQSTESSQSSQPATTSSSSSSSSSPAPSTESADDDGLSVHHVESFYGRVERSVQLPEDAKVDELTAKYENGVIKIEIPRAHEQKKEAKRIDIQ